MFINPITLRCNAVELVLQLHVNQLSLIVRQASAPECVSPAQRWILIDPDDKFIIKTKQKLEASDDKAIKEVTIMQAPSFDTEITRDTVDEGEVMMSANVQDTTSTASSDKKTDFKDFKEVIAQKTGESK